MSAYRRKTELAGLTNMNAAMVYTGVERRRQPSHIMSIPGTRGRFRFDGTISLGNLTIVLPLLALIFAAGGWKESIQSTVEHNTSTIANAIGAERSDVTELKKQESSDMAAMVERLHSLAIEVAGMEEKIKSVQVDVRTFAKSIGAPLPAPAAKK